MLYVTESAYLLSKFESFELCHEKKRRISNYINSNQPALLQKLDTVKLLNFRTPENFAVINLKFKQRGQTLVYSAKKMQME